LHAPRPRVQLKHRASRHPSRRAQRHTRRVSRTRPIRFIQQSRDTRRSNAALTSLRATHRLPSAARATFLNYDTSHESEGDMNTHSDFHIRVVEAIGANELSSERWPCTMPAAFYAWGVYSVRAGKLVHSSDHPTLPAAVRACARACALQCARNLVCRASRHATWRNILTSDFPSYPCPDDPDGLHHIGCGCSFED
jgi:hypothetical protein